VVSACALQLSEPLDCATHCCVVHSCRQQLIAPGEVADCIYLIGSGELEIFSPSGPGCGLSLSEPLISGLDLTNMQEQADPDVWDSTTVSDISKEPGGGQGSKGAGGTAVWQGRVGPATVPCRVLLRSKMQWVSLSRVASARRWAKRCSHVELVVQQQRLSATLTSVSAKMHSEHESNSLLRKSKQSSRRA